MKCFKIYIEILNFFKLCSNALGAKLTYTLKLELYFLEISCVHVMWKN